jgi:2-methylcitrate dehydratase PrpD
MSTQLIAKNIIDTTYEHLSMETIEATKKSILDIVGVILAASTLAPNCASIYDLIKEAGGNPESSILGFGGRAPCWLAAFVNGSLCHAIDFDDSVGVEKPLMHPTGSSFPAALATAERVGGISGRDFITAVALGNDLSVRLGACPNGNILSDYRFFPVTIFGVFGATAVSGKLLGLSESQMINALGLALNRVSGVTKGLFNSELREVRDGLNAKEGILCALLANKGMDACKDGLELLFETYYTNDYNIENLTNDLGKTFRGTEAGFKPWPSCLGTHSYVQAILQIVNEVDIEPAEVKEIILRGNQAGYALYNPVEEKLCPISSITAKIALPFIMGVAVAHKNVTLANFFREHLNDPVVLEMAAKVKFIVDESMGNFSAHVRIITYDNKEFGASVNNLYGSILDPMPIEDLVTKFKDCVRYSKNPLSEKATDLFIDKILNLEKLSDIEEFICILNNC